MKNIYILLICAILTSLLLIGAYTNGSKVISEPQIRFVSNTEYWSSTGPGASEHASTVIRIADYKGDPFAVSSCNATILYPNKSVYVLNGAMSPSGIAGNWYRTDLVPPAEGTYEQEVVCFYGSGLSVKTSQSFHVNPALNFIKNVSAEVLAADARLQDVNMSVTGEVIGAKQAILTQVSASETNLDSLMDTIYANITSKLNSVNASINTNMDNTNISITAKIADTGQTISTQLNLAETNLTALMNSARSDLLAQMAAYNVSIDAHLADAAAQIGADVASSKADIIAQIIATETNLTTLTNAVQNSLSAQLAGVNASVDARLTNVDAALSAKIAGTENRMLLNLSSAETNIESLISSVQSSTMSYLGLYLPSINQTAANIYADTRWLVANSIAQGNSTQSNQAEINSRFDAVDRNISLMESFCGNTLTNSSALCQEVYAVHDTLSVTRSEQTAYFSALNTTTTNTWNLLSGDIASGINALLADVGLIKSQTTQINATLEAMRKDQLEEVNIRVIS